MPRTVSAVLFLLSLAPATAVVAQTPVAPPAAPGVNAQQRNGLDVQEARTVHVKTRAKKVFYTRTWDLSGLPLYKPQGQVAGTIREWGSNYPADSDLNADWVAAFRKAQPNVRFEVNMRTALESAAALATGVADLAACRAFTFSDEELFERAHNHEPLRILVATGSYDVPGWSPALAIMVNKENPLSSLSMQQIDGIFGAERTGGYQGTTWHTEVARPASANIRTWGQLGLTGKWRDAPIHVYGLNLHYGMANDFANMVFHGGDKWNEKLIEYANYAAPDGTLKIGADQLMADLSHDPLGIGYSGMMFITPSTKPLALAATPGAAPVPLTMETVQNRTYPMLLELYFYLDREPGKPVDPKLREFLRFLLSREGQQAIVKDGKFLPLTPEAAAAELKKLD